ncbi:hypothetical protein MUO79_06950 [Candidatus Bathyarchaeota archaeon]|nr:hypothetical protein [Candidatus Bathyarchaeota archaeon]
MIEQPEHEISPKPTQWAKKTRSPEEKIGRIKWNQILLSRVLEEIKQLRQEMRTENRQLREEMKQLRVMERVIVNGFRGSGILKYTVPMIQQAACVDQVDIEILDSVFRAGGSGIYPKEIAVDIDVAADLSKRSPYGLSRFNVTDRIVRMNKRSMDEFSECLFEKRGQKWALTSFAFDVCGASEKDWEAERAGYSRAAEVEDEEKA